MTLRAMLACCVLMAGVAHAAPVLVRPSRGGRALEVDHVEDLVSLLGREYQVLTPAETAAWEQRRQEQTRADDQIQRAAEDRTIVYITGVLLTVFVLSTFVLVYWIRNKSKLR